MLQAFAPYAIIFILNLFGGGIATLGVGLALEHIAVNIAFVLVAIIIADTVSDIAYYCIGRFASGALQATFFKRSPKASNRFAMVERYYNEHGTSTIFLGKMSDILAIPTVMLAGASKMPLRKYLLICVPTSLLKTSVILLAGYLLSRSTDTADAHFVLYGISGVFLLVLVIVFSSRFYTTVKKAGSVQKR